MHYSDIIPRKIKRKKFRIYKMPKGTRVYHGTGATFDPSQIEAPFWVSTNLDVAYYFMNYHDHVEDHDDDAGEHQGYRIIEYVTNRPLKLLYVEGKYTFQQIEDDTGFSMSEPVEMAENVLRLGYDGWYIEDNYREGDDIMIGDSTAVNFVRIHKSEIE